MKFAAIVGAAMLAATAAGAVPIRWSYVETSLAFDPSSHVFGTLPLTIPETIGPLRYSFEVDFEDAPDFGRAPVTLRPQTFLYLPDFYEPPSIVRNVEVSVEVPGRTLGAAWDSHEAGSITIGIDGEVAAWRIEVYPMYQNSKLHFYDEFDSLIYYSVSDYRTYDATLRYLGSGGTWTRSGGDGIFPAPVPVPMTGALLAGGVLVLASAGAGRRAARRPGAQAGG